MFYFKKSILICFILLTPLKFYGYTYNELPPQPKAIIFDFGGVMMDFDLPQFFLFVANAFRLPLDKCKTLIKKEIPILAKGEMEESNFWLYFTKKYNLTLPKNWKDSYIKFVKTNVQPKKEMYHLINILKKDFQIAMLSDVTSWQADAFQKLGLYDHFSPRALSFEIKVKKPNDSSYHIILNMLNLPPEQCLFIDDRIENVQQAKKLGMHSLHFISYDQLVKDLSQMNVLNPF